MRFDKLIGTLALGAALFASTSSILAAPPSPVDGQAAVTAADGVKIDPLGNPFYGTFSLCAIDPATGESGVVVTTRVPFVGRAVPWARAGVGAVATQSWTVVEYGRQGLDLLAGGLTPQETIDRLLSDDNGRELRQIGMIDMKGRSAAFSGEKNGSWAGSRQGRNYTVQGNVLVGSEVIESVALHFESTAASGMPLAERMILALEAGQAKGGDKRWGNFQSAAMRIADPDDPGRGGDHLSFSIDVGEHENPVAEMKRIYYRTARRLGYRSFSEIRGPDVVELKRMLHALGYLHDDLEVFPESPDFEGDRATMRQDPESFMKAVEIFRQENDRFENDWALYDEAARAAVDAFRKAHDLDHPGLPKGLVDGAFIEVLRREYHGLQKEKGDKNDSP